MDPRTLFFHEQWGRLIDPIVGPGEPVGPNQVGVELLGDIRIGRHERCIDPRPVLVIAG